MSGSKGQRPPDIKDWTTVDVREWLLSEVKVSLTCAERFFEEDVCGEYLVDYNKDDVLELDIKHGPAVKIIHHLKQRNEQPKAEPQCPAYVHSWTKEQVNLWLLQHVKLYEKSAQRLLDEEVSGDCLVCFVKQDFKDLEIKLGPAGNILKALRCLKDKPEPVLQPVPAAPTDEEAQEPGPSVSQAEVQPMTQKKAQEKTRALTETPNIQVQNTPQRETFQPPSAPNMKTTAEISGAPCSQDSIPTMIYDVLNDLVPEEIETFCFHLRQYHSNGHKRIPRSQLQSTAQRDIAYLLHETFQTKALQVTKDILQMMNKNESASQLEKAAGPLMSEDSQSRTISPSEADQGEKLKNLLTCGGNSLDNYEKFVIVLNKSRPDQVQHLHFLNKLKLFCVLDFDPNSVCPGGVCHSYRKERTVNLHKPSQYQGKTEAVIKNLNLHKQTSWVFCNGRNDLGDTSYQELDYKSWLRTSCKDVEQLVSFIFKSDVLCHGEFLIIFLLLSPVKTEKDAVFETYKCFYKNTSEKNIVTLCGSKSVFSKWKKLIHEKCDTDIDPFSVSELSLSEINGTIMALGPLSQSSAKLLPSSDSSLIVLKKKDEDLMTALEVLCVNQCENIHDESSQQFQQFKLNQEEEFYRGGKVSWWNFYFCDKDKERPFIKRDKYENVKKMIRTQLKYPQNSCVRLILFHHPGCGASTLAMHIMWDFRKELRCAVLKDNKVSKEEVADQVTKLMKLENGKPCTVLLLVDDSKETDTTYELGNIIQKTAFNLSLDSTNPYKVIIFHCVRSHNPQELYKDHITTPCQYLTASLTEQEQHDFEKKLKELEATHNKPENFYSFMLMKSNFNHEYTCKLASNTLESFDISTKKAKLFAFLALLNTYVADSEISLSLCEDFVGIEMIGLQNSSVLKRMDPYANLLIIERVEDWGGYKGVRILHNQIAAACLEQLETRYELKVSDITTEILHCDLFYSSGVVKNRLMMCINQMLIERPRKKDGERELFSPLVEQIHDQQGRQTVQEIFVKASSRFEASASIPQALARYLYIKEQDFPEALKWAQKAKDITKNSYMLDTIAQVYKSNLKHNMEREKQEKSHLPEDLDVNLKIAVNAIVAFERAQELAKALDEAEEEPEDDQDYPRKSYTIYGYVGVVEITFLVFDVLGRLPFFQSDDPMKKMYLKNFLERNIPITRVPRENDQINERYVEIIRENEHFLLNLKNKVKETFKILEDFFTYLKANYSEFDSKNRSTVCEHFKKYVTLFCTEPEQMKKERQSNPQIALKIEAEHQRLFLEKKNADTFSGILQNMDRPATEMEKITQAYAYLHKHKQFNSKTQATKVTTNYILSNIVLYLSNRDSKHVQSYKGLCSLLHKTLQEVGLRSNFPDPFYTALLLLWPGPSDEETDIQTYVTAIRHSSRKLLSAFNRRSTVAHLYLAKGSGLKRLVSKLQLDKNFKEMHRNVLAQLWRSGDIFKEKSIRDKLLRVAGTIEEGEVYAKYGSQKVRVHPALISGTRNGFSTEKVSFFLGFAINGPLAYDIKNEN